MCTVGEGSKLAGQRPPLDLFSNATDLPPNSAHVII